MLSPLEYYPEFDHSEVAETIAPLAQFDEQVAAVLRAGDEVRGMIEKWVGEPEDHPFQRIVRSIAAGVVDAELVDACADVSAEERAVLPQLLARTESRLHEVCSRPLVAAVNRARHQGLLRGATPEERYRDFVERSARTSFEQVSGLTFPVLQSLTRIVVTNEANAFRELLRRLRRDRPAIREAFGIDETDALVSLGGSEGDAHHHGRTVCVLAFASGRRLVYKPRDVSCEAGYDTLARRLNDRLGLRLVSASVLQRDGYGYVEFVESEDVSDIPADFMRASGELAAVLFLLNARDMHFENILPTRRGPLPIDLETILHPVRVHAGPVAEAPGNAYTTIGQSIYGLGILPLVMAGKDGQGHVDLGFLGDQGRGTSPFKSLQFDAPFTDHVRLALRSLATSTRQTVVDALSEDAARELGEEMADGFSRVWRMIRADLPMWEGLLRELADGVRVRYVHNPTSLYSQTLRMTSSPSALDSTSTYLALLKRIAIASKTSDRQIIRSEMRQLAERDIPYFTIAATGTAIQDGDGEDVGAHVAQSPLDQALTKAAQLGEAELAAQLRLIYSAFASRFPDNHLAAPDLDADPVGVPARRGTGDTLTPLLVELCDHLVDTALPDKFDHLPRTWIGPLASAEADRPWPPGVLGYELYTGRTGPALALAAAGRLLDRPRYRALATQIFATTSNILTQQKYETRSIRQAGFSAYTGLAGTLFALAGAGRLLDEPEWVCSAQESVPLVLEQIRDQDPARLPLDVIGGLAGVLTCVTAIGGPHETAAVAELTSLLLAGLEEGSPELAAVLAQSGFAHGVSGVVHALASAYPTLPVEQHAPVESALSALADHLRRFYDPEQRNWLSALDAEPTFSTGWCHGSTGIALALSALESLTGDPVSAGLRDQAVANIVRGGFGRNLTWCHGDLGNHDALAALAGRLDPALATEIRGVEERWLRPEVIRRKVHDHRSRYAHTNSLMVGTAGIVVHLVGRIDPAVSVSPTTLELGRAAR